MSDFSGFSFETISFLKELEANNSKPWFDSNRARYEAHYLDPAKDFVTAIGPKLHGLRRSLNAEPRVNGSIFRVNRDIRFSKDKTPYKPHIDMWFWEGERKGALSGLFFRLTPDALILGAGAHGFQPAQLKAYRTAVAGSAGTKLLKVEKQLRKIGIALSGEHYKKPPRGFEAADEEHGRLLRYNALHAFTETAHPSSIGSSAFVSHCVNTFKKVLPVHIWLMDSIGR